MIEIIIQKVEMPELPLRRFQKHPKDCNGTKWYVEDTQQGNIIYTGFYIQSVLICHNLNKKYYLNLKIKTK